MDSVKTDEDTSMTELIQDLDRLKLLVAFDAILVEGTLARAAGKLGKTPSAMSRILRQLREHYGQELFERTGKGMVPTAFAENLRPRIRALVAEANSLLLPECDSKPVRDSLLSQPPLALNQWRQPDRGPGATDIAQRIAVMNKNPEASLRFASYIATIGNTAGQTRPLNAAEADDAFTILLSGQPADVQIGAFLIALQSRGLTEQELVGFTRAARRHSHLDDPGTGPFDLDWPAYLSPRTQGAPLFIHAARLVARAGYRVLMHGPHNSVVHRAFDYAQLPVLTKPEAEHADDNHGILAYLPIENFAPDLRKLHWLYPLFMMPNATQYVSALLNPGAAPATLAGIRGSDRPKLQLEAARELGWDRFAVLLGHRDAAQIVPHRSQALFVLRDGEVTQNRLFGPASNGNANPETNDNFSRLEKWQAIWDGSVANTDATAAIIETAAVALNLLSISATPMDHSRAEAAELWANRRK